MAEDDLRSGNRARQLRFVEWVLLCAVLLALGGIAWRQSLQLQAQAEGVAFRATVRALKQALMLAQLQGGAPPDANPFDLLERKPANYAGAMSLGQAMAHASGQWVVDADCGCLAYLPRQAWALHNASGSPWVLLNLRAQPGHGRLTVREPCTWLGETML